MSLHFDEKKTRSYTVDIFGNEHDVAPYFEVQSLIKKIPDKCESEEIEIMYQSEVNKPTVFRIPIEFLSDIKMFTNVCFTNYFLFLPSRASLIQSEIILELSKIKKENQIKYENKSIGWFDYNGQDVFLMDEKTLPDGTKFSCIRDMGKWVDGDVKKYDEMLTKYVYPNHRMSLAYILGFSGVLVARISKLKDLGVVLSGISGQSTTGKTTAIKLMASIWADPDDVKGRIIMRADASNIGFNAQFAGFNGPCIIFDDVDQNSTLDLANKLNTLSRGAQRVVANQKGEAQFNRMGFGGICVFVSECPLLEKTRKESGLYPRFIDLQDIVWTDDSESAEAIKSICSQNFGFKGKIFAEFIEKKTNKQLCSIYDSAYKFINDITTEKDNFTARANKKYACIIATANLLMDCFGIVFDIEEIAKILMVNEKLNREERDKGTQTYDYLKQFFIENHASFNLIGEEQQLSAKGYMNLKSAYGIAVFKQNKLHLYIKVATVDEILTKAGFNQLSNYKRVWKEKGWTMCAKDRFDCSTTTLMPCRHFHFVYPDYDKQIRNFVYIFRTQFEYGTNVEYGKNSEIIVLSRDLWLTSEEQDKLKIQIR